MYNVPDYDPDDKYILILPEDDLDDADDEAESPRVWTWRRIVMLIVAVLIITAMVVTYLLFFLPEVLNPPLTPTPVPRPGSVI